MDMAITSLRQKELERGPKAGARVREAVRLTGCYHNLLRMWAVRFKNLGSRLAEH